MSFLHSFGPKCWYTRKDPPICLRQCTCFCSGQSICTHKNKDQQKYRKNAQEQKTKSTPSFWEDDKKPLILRVTQIGWPTERSWISYISQGENHDPKTASFLKVPASHPRFRLAGRNGRDGIFSACMAVNQPIPHQEIRV